MKNTIFSKDTLNRLLPEKMIHHYQAINLIAANHHNIILSVLSNETEEKFILKIFDREYYDKNLYHKIFNITHASLLLPLQIFSDASCFYFVYPHFKTLAEALSTKSISYSTLHSLIFSIGNAVVSLHKHGILHLDITPNNIFLDNEGKYYLGDFSSALPVKNLLAFLPRRYLRTGTTQSFALPEQLQTPPVSYWNDCYNLALLIFTLFNNGKFPDETILPPLPAIERLNSFLLKWMKLPPSIYSGMVKDFLDGLEEILDTYDKEKELQNYNVQLSDSNDSQNFFLEKTPDCSIENFSFPKTSIFNLPFSKNSKISIPLYGLLFFCSFLFLFSLYHYLSQNSHREEEKSVFLSETVDYFHTETKKTNKNLPLPSNISCPTTAPSRISTPLPDITKQKTEEKYILDISSDTYQKNSFLQNITNPSSLQILFANHCQLSTCTAFSSLTSLRELYLSNNKITFLIGLTNLSKLEVLVLSKNKLTDISSLSRLSSLITLDLSHNNNLKGIKSLSSLIKLRYLILTNTNVSKKEILFLQKKLPDCTILY